jgi:hypothetical protein
MSSSRCHSLPPLHRLFAAALASVSTPLAPPCPAHPPPPSPESTGEPYAMRHALLSTPQSTMDPSCAAWSTRHGHGRPRYFLLKNKSPTQIPHHIPKNPLHLSEIKPRSTEIPTGTLEFKNISKNTPSHFPKITNRSLKLFWPYLHNRNSDFGDSYAKILRITSYFMLYIH